MCAGSVTYVIAKLTRWIRTLRGLRVRLMLLSEASTLKQHKELVVDDANATGPARRNRFEAASKFMTATSQIEYAAFRDYAVNNEQSVTSLH